MQLDIFGGTGRGSSESLLEIGSGECAADTLPSSILSRDLSDRNSRRLHIYANIGKVQGSIVL